MLDWGEGGRKWRASGRDSTAPGEVRLRRKGYRTVARTFDSEQAARKWAREAEHELALRRGATPDTAETRMTLAEALDRYQEQRTVEKRGAEQEKSRIRVLKRCWLASMPLGQVGSAEIVRYIADRSKVVASQTIHHELHLISDLFNHAKVAWGMAELKNPVTDVRKPTLPQHRDRRLEGDEESRLLAEAGPDLHAAFKFALETGMRRGKLVNLTWRDVDFGKRIIRLARAKTGRREVPLSTAAIEVLESLPRRLDGRVFGWTDAHSITRAFERACKRAHVQGLTWHDLRHEALSQLAERGFDVPTLAVVSGHRSWAALKRYVNLRAEGVARKLG